MANSLYFGRGVEIELVGSQNAFPMSPAGKFFADHVAAAINAEARNGRVLDMGTGTGVLSILLKLMGCRDVTAVDLSETILSSAKANVRRNMQARWWCQDFSPEWTPHVRFDTSDLFSNGNLFGKRSSRWDLIVFNAPGWRTPIHDASTIRLLNQIGPTYYSRFGGDRVIQEFLINVGRHLTSHGRVLLTMNSIAGINNILRSFYTHCSDLEINLIVRKEFQIDLSIDMWAEHKDIIVEELQLWRKPTGSYFDLSDDRLSFEFEVYDVRRKRKPHRTHGT